MKVNPKLCFFISVILLISSTSALAQMRVFSLLRIYIGDDQGSATYDMVFGNHVNATWGMNAEKDSLWMYGGYIIEKESPPLLPGLGVVWRPARSGVSWGIGFMKYDIKDYTDIVQKDTFKLYFANASASDADITFSWPGPSILRERCTALILRIGADYYNMFAHTSVTIPDAGDNSISQAYIYKSGAFTESDFEVKNQNNDTPENFGLSQNYPNPFNPSTQITYSVPIATYVTLKVYDLLGREMSTLVNERKQTREYNITWNAEGVPSGVYFYRIVAGNYIETKKMVLIR